MSCINVSLKNEYIHTDGNQYVFTGSGWVIRASTLNNAPVGYNTTVFISYAGSTAPYGTAFSGPSQVVIKSGTSYTDFNITVYDYDSCSNCNDRILINAATANIGCCSPKGVSILCEKGELRVPGKDCCLFYDKTHEVWRDYYPTCMGNNKGPKFPGNMMEDGTSSSYDWYDSELYK